MSHSDREKVRTKRESLKIDFRLVWKKVEREREKQGSCRRDYIGEERKEMYSLNKISRLLCNTEILSTKMAFDNVHLFFHLENPLLYRSF